MAEVTHPAAERHDRYGRAARSWSYFLQYALLLGIFAATMLRRLDGDIWPHGWTIVFVSLAMLCLGFGTGLLFNQRQQQRQADALRQDYAELSARAHSLGVHMDERIRRKQS